MTIAQTPSKLSLPQHNPGVSTVLAFLILRFPAISPQVWLQRVLDGKVHWHDGRLITPHSPFVAQQRVYYYREVAQESLVPHAEQIIFQDELILVAYKPAFLPVTPGGRFVEQCLQSRLRKRTGNQNLQSMHRIDRATAGLVLFSKTVETRQLYHYLFDSQQVDKTYQGVANITAQRPQPGQTWQVKNRIEKSQPTFLMQIVPGEANSHSLIRCMACSKSKALFELKPISGKTHQLRLHMQSIGWPLLNDRYYPSLQTERPDDANAPLQLLAQKLQFIDPITQKLRLFDCNKTLTFD